MVSSEFLEMKRLALCPFVRSQDGTVCVWDIRFGKVLAKFHSKEVSRAARLTPFHCFSFLQAVLQVASARLEPLGDTKPVSTLLRSVLKLVAIQVEIHQACEVWRLRQLDGSNSSIKRLRQAV